MISNQNDKSMRYSKISEKSLHNLSYQKFEAFEEEKKLSLKASEFIRRLRQDKKQLQGKISMHKWEEKKRREEEQKQNLLDQQIEKQLKKNIRKMKAEINIQFFKCKQLNRINEKKYNSFRSLVKTTATDSISVSDTRKRVASVVSELGQIKEEEQGLVPQGFKKTNITSRKRSKTESKDYTNQKNSEEELAVSSRGSKNATIRKNKIKGVSQNIEKKVYLMSKNDPPDIKEFIQQYEMQNGFLQLIKNKSQKKSQPITVKNSLARKAPTVSINSSKQPYNRDLKSSKFIEKLIGFSNNQ